MNTVPTTPNLKVIQSTLESGAGPYSNPKDIYNPGHKLYTNYVFGENDRPDISGIVNNINLLKDGSELKLMQPKNFIQTFNPYLSEDYKIEEEYSALSVNLKFNNHNIITTTNIFKNL